MPRLKSVNVVKIELPHFFVTVCVLIFQEHENPKIQGCLTWLHQRAMGPNRFRVRFLEDLSLELYAHVGKNVSESSILNMLTTSVFDYEPNTRYSAIVYD